MGTYHVLRRYYVAVEVEDKSAHGAKRVVSSIVLLLTTRINNGVEWWTCRSDCRQLLRTHGTPTTLHLLHLLYLYFNILICLYHPRFCIFPRQHRFWIVLSTQHLQAKASAGSSRGARNSSELDAHRAVSLLVSKQAWQNPAPRTSL